MRVKTCVHRDALVTFHDNLHVVKCLEMSTNLQSLLCCRRVRFSQEAERHIRWFGAG